MILSPFICALYRVVDFNYKPLKAIITNKS